MQRPAAFARQTLLADSQTTAALQAKEPGPLPTALFLTRPADPGELPAVTFNQPRHKNRTAAPLTALAARPGFQLADDGQRRFVATVQRHVPA